MRNGLNPTRVYLIQIGSTDSTGREIAVEVEVPPPAKPVAVNANYSIWSIDMADGNFYNIEAEVDGSKLIGNDVFGYGAAGLKACPTST